MGLLGKLRSEAQKGLALHSNESMCVVVRAALTALRKRGFVVTLDRSSKERGSTYGIPRDQCIADETAQAQTIEPPPAPADRTTKPARRAKSERAAISSAA